jgi:hypothetical protein
VAVATSARGYAAVMKKLRVREPDAWCEAGWFACVHAFEVRGELVCVVALNVERLVHEAPIDAACHLVHEAVHVWQRVRDFLGPGDLGREMEAYAIQNIAAELMRAYVRATSSASALGAAQAS